MEFDSIDIRSIRISAVYYVYFMNLFIVPFIFSTHVYIAKYGSLAQLVSASGS